VEVADLNDAITAVMMASQNYWGGDLAGVGQASLNQMNRAADKELIPTDAKDRKEHPICTGVLDYFPQALMEVARCSKIGNDQHNPGQPLHWAKEKSMDEADALVRHLLQRGTRDTDGVRHSAKVAWRALALLEREIEAERADAK